MSKRKEGEEKETVSGRLQSKLGIVLVCNSPQPTWGRLPRALSVADSAGKGPAEAALRVVTVTVSCNNRLQVVQKQKTFKTVRRKNVIVLLHK